MGASHFGRSSRPAAISCCSRPRPNPRTGRRSSRRFSTELGAWDLEPRSDADSLEAAAALCRSAGYWALALSGRRAARPAERGWRGRPGRGRRHAAFGGARGFRPSLGRRDIGRPAQRRRRHGLDRTRASSPNCSWAPRRTGRSGRAARRLCCRAGRCSGCSTAPWNSPSPHVRLRQQFGQPLSGFQGVQFQLTDAEVERSGLEELAKHALWSVAIAPADALADALALRMAAIEAAEVVFRVCHQLHGAIGFCDETTLSWLSRYSQPLRRLPFGLSATRDQLTRPSAAVSSADCSRRDRSRGVPS